MRCRMCVPGKRLAEILMELTLSLPYILLGFALLLIFSSPLGKALKEAGFAWSSRLRASCSPR